jgi:serine/threonine-protein kinase
VEGTPTTIDRTVALKMLLPHFAQDPDFEKRFPRCMSYFSAASGDRPLVFSGGKWAWTDSSDGPCPNGDPSHLTADSQYPLPQPSQDPIPSLSGHGTWEQTGSCAVNLEFDEAFAHTGD